MFKNRQHYAVLLRMHTWVTSTTKSKDMVVMETKTWMETGCPAYLNLGAGYWGSQLMVSQWTVS
jgi:hypothetical protein